MAVSQSLESRLERPLPDDYMRRVYAGVLGKIIGVYAGRPVENWSYERIADRFGEIRYYVHEQLGRRLIITDDDISGTFVFLRALRDHGFRADLSAQEIGESWLNYLIEKKTILWWGGLGNSTEHTAYLRLKAGVQAPESGSTARNGRVVAEQIGAQIFIDGWGMLCPGDPALAAGFAHRAASVSHDGEAIYGAQVIAALVAGAFAESRIDVLLDQAVAQIPASSQIAQLIQDLRRWHAVEPDWRANRERLEAEYGYPRFGGNCPMVPNHGAILLSLLHGDGDFTRSMHIVNTIGWDTDCNSGNLGCILGVLGGLEGLESGLDWRGPVADRLFLPCANPGIAISDALRVACEVVESAHRLRGLNWEAPKGGARFHFSEPGSVQGFRVDAGFESRGVLSLDNPGGALRLRYQGLGPGRAARCFTDTFIPLETRDLVTGYVLVASPTLQPGQTVRAQVSADSGNAVPIVVGLDLRAYDATDSLTSRTGPKLTLAPGQSGVLEWTIEATGGYPIAELGVVLSSDRRADGIVEVDRIHWDGAPNVELTPQAGTLWARAWGCALDRFEHVRDGFKHLAQDRGRGLLIQGSDHWRDYAVETTAWFQMAKRFGVAARVQGLRRYVALTLNDEGQAEILLCKGEPRVLASTSFPSESYRPYRLRLVVRGKAVEGWIDDKRVLEAALEDDDLGWGGAAFLVEEGCMGAEGMRIAPA